MESWRIVRGIRGASVFGDWCSCSLSDDDLGGPAACEAPAGSRSDKKLRHAGSIEKAILMQPACNRRSRLGVESRMARLLVPATPGPDRPYGPVGPLDSCSIQPRDTHALEKGRWQAGSLPLRGRFAADHGGAVAGWRQAGIQPRRSGRFWRRIALPATEPTALAQRPICGSTSATRRVKVEAIVPGDPEASEMIRRILQRRSARRSCLRR